MTSTVMECELLGDVSIAAVFLVLLTLFLCLIFSCCIWGEGSYELSFDGNVVASGGEFGFDETKTFTTPSTVPSSITTTSVARSSPEDI